MTRRRKREWPLADLWRACHSAPAVWLALLELADSRSIITPTRAKLSQVTGIKQHKTISTALTALEQAGWIDRLHVPVRTGGRQTATLLRILIVRRRGRFSPSTARKHVEGEKRPKGRGRKTPSDFPYRERRARSAFRPSGAGKRNTPATDQPKKRAELKPGTLTRAKWIEENDARRTLGFELLGTEFLRTPEQQEEDA